MAGDAKTSKRARHSMRQNRATKAHDHLHKKEYSPLSVNTERRLMRDIRLGVEERAS
jgi:hypothetical protein